MPYRFRRKETVQAGVRRIAREQISKALRELTDEDLDEHETVHQVRKRCKKVRGLLRLCRPSCEVTYREGNAAFRDAARGLSSLRDAQTLIETADSLRKQLDSSSDRRALDALREGLGARRDRIAEKEVPMQVRLPRFRAQMEESLRAVDQWQVGAGGFASVGGGLQRTYRRGRRSMSGAVAQPSAERFHEWRKRVKYHWYHVRLLRKVWPADLEAREDALDELSGLLGDEHDLAVLSGVLSAEAAKLAEKDVLRRLLPAIDRQRGELQTRAWPLGARLFAEKPKHLGRRLGRYWETWRAGG